MTSTLSPDDTGEIQIPTRYSSPDIGAVRRDVGEQTQNLPPYTAFLPPALRRPDATAEIALIPPGQPTPPPLPPPPPTPRFDLPDAPVQPIAPLERVAGADETAVVSLLGALAPAGEPVEYVGRHRAPEHGRFRRWLVAVGITLAAAVGVGCSGAATPDPAPTSSPIVVEKLAGLGEGTYKVGSEIKPGTYTTTVPDDQLNCYWARLKSFDGELTSLIANGNIATNGRGRITVKRTDKGVEFQGACRWVAAK